MLLQANITRYIGDLAVFEDGFFRIEVLSVKNVDKETGLSDICRRPPWMRMSEKAVELRIGFGKGIVQAVEKPLILSN